MRADAFRRIALALDGAVEGAHMGHPDFRLEKTVFASLHSKNQFGVVKLTPEQQKDFIEGHPDTFAPESGAWGRSGYTRIILKAAEGERVGEALTLAWQNVKAAKSQRRTGTSKSKRKTGR
jgi:hypothetical protein